MFPSYRLGTLFGFPIEVNLSFLVMLGLSLLWGVDALFIIPVAFGSVLLHELGHALVARHLGVRVAGIELHFFGGAAKMIEQPRSANDEIAIAAAGPAVSFALGGLGFALAAATGLGAVSWFAWLNTIIGAFNLIPALPMDGGRIFRALLSRRMGFARATELAVKVARVFAVGLGVVGLVTVQVYLVLLAGVLWLMTGNEARVAARHGYGGRFDAPGLREVVMPPGFGFDRRASTPPPPGARAAGFAIRRRNGRIVIERAEL